jgi:glutaconate CoA-transferase subunit B
MRLDSLHPGATLDDIRSTLGWEPRIADDLQATAPPSETELDLIRRELDPEGAYTR